VLVVGRCPDPASPDGYGEPQLSPYTPPVPEGDILVQGLGTYTVTWQRRVSYVGTFCDSTPGNECLSSLLLEPCSGEVSGLNVIRQVFTGLAAGFSIGSVYGMRVFSTKRTTTYVCGPGESTSVFAPLISVSAQQTPGGPWVTYPVTLQGAQGVEGTVYTIYKNHPADEFTAINLKIVKQ
jgi:hypothetical protein